MSPNLDPDDEPDDSPFLTEAERRAFKRYVAGLNKLIAQVRERYPDAQYYLACSMGARLHLLSGSSHDDDHNARPRQDRIIETETLRWADGGDW
jgi:hypothetical protein